VFNLSDFAVQEFSDERPAEQMGKAATCVNPSEPRTIRQWV